MSSHHLGGFMDLPVGMRPSIHKATEGSGGVSFSASQRCLVHARRACHTKAAIGQCMNACSCVSSSWHTSHCCCALGPCWCEPTMCALCSTLVCTHTSCCMSGRLEPMDLSLAMVRVVNGASVKVPQYSHSSCSLSLWLLGTFFHESLIEVFSFTLVYALAHHLEVFELWWCFL